MYADTPPIRRVARIMKVSQGTVERALELEATPVGREVSRAFAKRTTAAEESCTTGVMTEGRMAGASGDRLGVREDSAGVS